MLQAKEGLGDDPAVARGGKGVTGEKRYHEPIIAMTPFPSFTL